jgi:hypothetical protein
VRVKGVSEIQAVMPEFQNGFYCDDYVNAEGADIPLNVEVSVKKRIRSRPGNSVDKCSQLILSGRIRALELATPCYADWPGLTIHLH